MCRISQKRSTWYINISTNPTYRVIVRGADKITERNRKASYSHLHRVIVSYINSKYNLPPLTDDLIVDHISGNTFNNLYYPFNDYYNNLRVCNNQQNTLNTPCQGYNVENGKYRAKIIINGETYRKTCATPEECVKFDLDILMKISPENANYYYLSPTNPRNDPTTFSNTYLNYIGYNDRYKSHFEEFVFTESDEDTEIYANPNNSLNCNLLDDDN